MFQALPQILNLVYTHFPDDEMAKRKEGACFSWRWSWASCQAPDPHPKLCLLCYAAPSSVEKCLPLKEGSRWPEMCRGDTVLRGPPLPALRLDPQECHCAFSPEESYSNPGVFVQSSQPLHVEAALSS